MNDAINFYRGKQVLVTGGAGFLGSNLATRFVQNEIAVTVVDNFHPDYGANPFNLEGLGSNLNLIRGDITDRALMKELCGRADVIYHIAAQCSHVDSMIDPWLDLKFNCEGTLAVLEGAKASAKKPVVVYAGTRAIIGAPLESPAGESTLPNPVDVYGVNKLAAEWYGAVYARVHGIPYVSLRLTNCFGERHQMKNGKYGILNWFMSLALQGKTIKIYGTGAQLRDYLYVSDAIDSFVAAGRFGEKLRNGESFPEVQLSGEKVPFAIFNVASGKPKAFAECAKRVATIGGGSVEFVPWPKDREAIETGDFVATITAAERYLGWRPKVEFEAGLQNTFAYYRQHLSRYL
ncbi:MAG TPA: NAD-dependent epimerase/dehydratase family protein, partial [Oligoflexia bacterium]|nr:NAD-dependent epimerase/dehydratase family protein [Oligoflexia bacterium]